MKRATKEVIECEEGDLTPLIAILTDVDRRDGWVNLTPGVPADIDLDEDRSLVSFLAGSSRVEAPLATWMPAQRGSGKPGTLGLHRFLLLGDADRTTLVEAYSSKWSRRLPLSWPRPWWRWSRN